MNEKKKIAFHTLGCKLNFAETSTISRNLDHGSYDIVDFKETADVYVINTCLVTATAEKKCVTAIKQAHNRNPEAVIAVVGCYSEIKPENLEGLEGVRLVLGNTEKFSLEEYLKSEAGGQKSEVGSRKLEAGGQKSERITNNEQLKTNVFSPSYSIDERTRSFLKVQDGCDYFCSYCIIPIARGRSRSATINEVIKSAEEIASHGIKEIVLTGVNIGDFGRWNNETLLQLIIELEMIDGIERYRISSIEPDLLKKDIIEFASKSEKFLPHFHLPLQSGSDKILRLMHRKYNKQLFSERCKTIRQMIPHCLIAADVIVGFPGETDEDFQETYDFIKESEITYTHIFPYSEREGTLALKLDGVVPIKVRKERVKKLQEISDMKKAEFYQQNKLSIRKVLFESDYDNGFMYGFTDNYIKVKTMFDEKLINNIVEVKLANIETDGDYLAESV